MLVVALWTLGVAMWTWAVAAALRKHQRVEAVMWVASGLLLGVFAVIDHLGVPRWLSATVLLASLVFGLLAGWRSNARSSHGQ